jgi:DNA-binding CsgD family transcriptional regulator
MTPDQSGPPSHIQHRHRPVWLESQRFAFPAELMPGIEPPALPAGHGSRAPTAAESDHRQLAAQVQAQIIAPLKLLLAQAAAFEQTLTVQPTSRMAVSVLAGLARQVLQQAYDLEANLHPVLLETLGLEPALEALVAQYERLHSLRLVFSLERLSQRLPSAVELALFRLCQEVLDAMCDQHVLQVQVALKLADQTLQLEFTCLGETFLSEPLRTAALQRIQPFGGTLTIGRLADGQAHLAVHIPLRLGLSFTPRESQVLDGPLQGWSNKEIAICLSISARTVNFHVDHIFTKLGVHTRTEAVVAALAQGLVFHVPMVTNPDTHPG